MHGKAHHNDTPAMLAKRSFTLSKLHRLTGIDMGYLSRIFAGKQCPSLTVTETIAVCVGWTMDELTVMLRERQAEQEAIKRIKEQEDDGQGQIIPEDRSTYHQESKKASSAETPKPV